MERTTFKFDSSPTFVCSERLDLIIRGTERQDLFVWAVVIHCGGYAPAVERGYIAPWSDGDGKLFKSRLPRSMGGVQGEVRGKRNLREIYRLFRATFGAGFLTRIKQEMDAHVR